MPAAAYRPLPTGHIKGAALAEFIRWCEREQGRAVLAGRVATLPPMLRDELALDDTKDTLGILASRWYDAHAIGVLIDAMIATAAPDEREIMARRAADVVMRGTLRGIYRVLFQWLATPDRYADFANRLWRSYHDTGVMAVVQINPTTAICTLRDWGGHHAFTCAMCRASAEVIYTEMGCQRVKCVRECCIDDGADECRFVTTWM